jgi:hypothetical protein
LGAEQTAEFSIVSRIFFAIIGVFSVLLIQLWNSVTEANLRNDNKWILRAAKRLFFIAVLILLGSIILSINKNSILHIWLGKQFVNISSSTFYLFSFYTFFHCLNAIIVNIQNGLGLLKLQIISTSASILIYLSGCLLFSMNDYGYNYLIVLKIIGTIVAIGINSITLFRLNRTTNLNVQAL